MAQSMTFMHGVVAAFFLFVAIFGMWLMKMYAKEDDVGFILGGVLLCVFFALVSAIAAVLWIVVPEYMAS